MKQLRPAHLEHQLRVYKYYIKKLILASNSLKAHSRPYKSRLKGHIAARATYHKWNEKLFMIELRLKKYGVKKL